MRSLFHLLLGGIPPGKRRLRNLHGNPPPLQPQKMRFFFNRQKSSVRSLFHLLLGGSPLVNGDLKICMELPPQTSKIRQNTLILKETAEADWL